MKNFNFFLLSFFCLSVFSSCVSLKKYRASENSLMTAVTNNLTAKEQLLNLEKDTARLGGNYRACAAERKELEEYSAYSQSMLYLQMNKQGASLDEKEAEIATLSKELKITKTELAEKSTGFAESSTQLAKVEKLIKAQKDLIVNLRLSAGAATAGFEDKNVGFEAKDGKVKVIVPENLLFSSSSATSLTKSGETSLMSIANVISQNSQFAVVVESHSDNSKSRDNWDFTARRAANITEFLIKGGVNPSQVMPSGRGEFSPMVENITPEDKATNRRIEIILTPTARYINELLMMY